jgi:hypothetical protein
LATLITGYGAGNNGYGGSGAIIRGNFTFPKNFKLTMQIGQMGKHRDAGNGGTFVIDHANSKKIVIAGGAGGGIGKYSNARTDKFGNRLG